MKLKLKRKYQGKTYTIGDLLIDGHFFCNTIEDVIRNLPTQCPDSLHGKSCNCTEKKYGETAIPAGIYRVTMEYSPKFKRVLPYLHDVPHFSSILIHSGNSEKDSAGCIIVGMNTMKGKVLDSRKTSDALNQILMQEKDVVIEIVDVR